MKVTVIGCGNLGGAVVHGLVNAGHDVVACDKGEDALARLPDGVETTTETDAAVKDTGAELVVVAVKPEAVGPVLESFDAEDGQVVASFAAAVSLGYVQDRVGVRAARVMPNLAGEYNEMAAAVCAEGDVPGEVERALDDLGDYVEVNEGLMDISTAVNGSGPAFVFYAMKAMRDAGVDGGLDEDAASALVAQTFRGAAAIAQNGERSLDGLIDAVCSPGGTTIEGMEVLRDADAGAPFSEAVAAAERRSEEITEELDL